MSILHIGKIFDRNVNLIGYAEYSEFLNDIAKFDTVDRASFAIVENNYLAKPYKLKDVLISILKRSGNISIYGPNATALEAYLDSLITEDGLGDNDETIVTTVEDELGEMLEWSIVNAAPADESIEYTECVIVIFPGEITISEVHNVISGLKEIV